MFMQVIQGRTASADQLRAALERWAADVAPGATGWLGSTAGVTPDGRFIALTRFESEAAARRNSERPEQHQWWVDAAKLLAGDATFHDCREVLLFLEGGSNNAGFVQVIQARAADTDRLREALEHSTGPMSEFRPDIIGGTVAFHGDGWFTQAVYFTSEAAVREGETKEPPPELRELAADSEPLFSDPEYYDLPEPWMATPSKRS